MHPVTVTANNLHTGMVAEPVHQGVSRGIFQQVDDTVRGRVHENRSVSVSAAKCEFVNPQHSWRFDWPLWDCPYHAQQRGAAGGHLQALALPTPWSATERETD